MSCPCFARHYLPLLLILLLAAYASAEWNEKVLYSFQGEPNDGFYPAGGVVFDKAGNWYGATTGAGADSCSPISEECGLVFQLSPPTQKDGAWTETILFQFKGKQSNDASVPSGGLIIDSAGNLYGVTAYGGTGSCVLLGTSAGCGTVFELSPPQQKGGQWTETILYSFEGGDDGYYPWGNLTFDKAGNLYGATQFGGGKGNTCNQIYGGNCGTVFELSPPKQKGGQWIEQVLHSFAGGNDGAYPNGGLVLDSKGAVYGTSMFGGYSGSECIKTGCGTVFKLLVEKSGSWTEKILHEFQGQDGAEPFAGIVLGKDGNLYGTVYAGADQGNGGIFRLSSKGETRHLLWKETLLYRFQDGTDGASPRDGITIGKTGELYGTALGGSTHMGVVFGLNPPKGRGSWTLSVLYTFKGTPDGSHPMASLTYDNRGSFYSATIDGGSGTGCGSYGCGAVFEVSP